MARPTFDIVTVGGGLGGAALARAMAERGARVLVLPDIQFGGPDLPADDVVRRRFFAED